MRQNFRLRDHLSENPTVEQIAAWAGVFPEATTINLGNSNLRAWSVEHIAALAGVFPQATTISLWSSNLGNMQRKSHRSMGRYFSSSDNN